MSFQNISIRGLTLSVLGALAIGTIAVSLFGVNNFSATAFESQQKAIQRMVHIATKQAESVMHDRTIEMVETFENELRAATKKMQKSPGDSSSISKVVDHLNDFFHQRYATTGLLSIKKLRLYDKDLNYLLKSSEGISGLDKKLPKDLLNKAKGRKGAERLKTVSSTWTTSKGSMHSMLVPIGGLRAIAYLEVIVSPEFSLQTVAEIVNLPLQIESADGTTLFESDQWQASETNDSMPIRYTYQDDLGETSLTLIVLEDMTAFYSGINNAQMVMVGGVVILVILGVLVSLWAFNAHVFKPLNNLVINMGLCADGDLSIQVKQQGLRDIQVLNTALSQLIEKLRLQVGSISQSAGSVASSAEQLSAVTEQSSAVAQRQMTENSQVTNAINEMSIAVQEVAESAVSAAKAAQDADTAAQSGRSVVNETIDSIKTLAEEVEQSTEVIKRVEGDSETVATVLDVIRDIAEQTNLLALNAAIEAARAGEQGRGFAVVADEVRTLAGRTRDSTQEIEKIIDSLQGEVRHATKSMQSGCERARAGVEQAHRAEEALLSITDAVSTIASMNDQIASAVEEQSAMSEEIKNNVDNISQLAQDSARGAVDSAQNAEELSQLALDLNQLVTHFKT